jgi:acetate---CoA ligase (ADP-forming)
MSDLAGMLSPCPVVIVGASDRSAWSRAIYWNLTEIGNNPVWLVNPNREVVHGAPTVASIDQIDDEVRLACITVNAALVAENLKALGRRGVRNAVIIASGFQEAGPEGSARADEIRKIVDSYDMTVVGPNTTGLINVAERFAPFGGMLKPTPRIGAVAIVSQSGALAGQLVGLANARGIGLSRVLATGNELGVTVSDALAYLVEDEQTRSIATFIEDIKDVELFRRTALRALEIGKPIVALKVGRTPEGRSSAMSHTGAVAGDDVVIEAAFRQLGVIRVRTLEEMLTVAGLMAGNRPITGRQMAVVMASGGLCDIIADESADLDLALPDFAPPTRAALMDLLPDYGRPNNPLDLTGVVVADPSVPERALTIVAKDPHVDFVLFPSFALLRGGGDEAAERSGLQTLAAMIAETPAPVVLVHTLPVNIPPEKQSLLAATGLHVSVGMEVTLKGLDAAVRWWERRKRFLAMEVRPAEHLDRARAGEAVTVWDEVTAREHLRRHDVAVVPGRLVTSASEAADAGLAIGLPVAVKVVSAGITHKTDVGGVETDIDSTAGVGRAFNRVVSSGRLHAEVDGALITKMRSPRAELLVAVTRDADWGSMLTLGLGGTAVEVLGDTASAMLPLTGDDIKDLLGSLRCAPLLMRTRRDGSSLDVDRIVSTVEGVIRAAEELADDLNTLEINPLAAGHGFTEAIDVLIVTHSG